MPDNQALSVNQSLIANSLAMMHRKKGHAQPYGKSTPPKAT